MSPERWREVEAAYQSVMDCEPELRSARLAAVCQGDDDLRREVESLVALSNAPVLVDQLAWHAGAELLDNDSMLAAGTMLGPYRIEGLLGSGGMGQVYRARDTRLDREVAIKLSHEEFEERFSREARAIAALNHPNVCALFDVGPNYLVMELVEGPTLADLIQQGPLPLDRALSTARQIADALDAAHGQGIVHRDLKPGNIKVKPDGVVKVLDFGLAKRQHQKADCVTGPENSPTISIAATRAGMMLGTAAYMSPEQARGTEVDRRADIWSFGVVLYEMLTGRHLFAAATVTDTLAAVLTREPDWSALPAQVRILVRACLERDPKQRLRDIADGWRLLQAQVSEGQPNRTRIPALAGVLAILTGIAIWGWQHSSTPPDRPLLRLNFDLGPDASLGSPFGPDAAISPDGTRLVFVSRNRLFVRKLDQFQSTELRGTEGASQPFFSPDSRWVGFFADYKVKKISTEGGGATVLSDAGLYPGGGTWAEDGTIIEAPEISGGLVQIAAGAGAPTPLTKLDGAHGEVTHRWPQVLPGGKAVLFTAHKAHVNGFDEASIEVVTLKDGRRKTLHTGGTYGRYLATGHLVYINRGVLYAVPFDLGSLQVRGVPTRVLDQVGYSTRAGFGEIDFSANGTAVYRTWSPLGLVTVQWLNGSGKVEPLPIGPGEYSSPVLSPDGARIAMSVSEGSSREIWIYDWQRHTSSRLTFGGGAKGTPVWSPDGRYVLFQARGGIYWVRVDAPGSPTLFDRSDQVEFALSFTPDGKVLLFQRGVGRDSDLWTVPVESDAAGLHEGKPERFLQMPVAERFGSFSPDGRWITYESDESGTSQVYVRPFHHNGETRQISSAGGVWARWSRTKPELYFSDSDGRILVVSYLATADTFSSGQPQVWSAARLANPWLAGRNFDPAPGGERILGLMRVEGEEPEISRNHIIFLENFFDELRRRVTDGKFR